MTNSSKANQNMASVSDLMKTMQDASLKSMSGFGTEWLESMTNMTTEMFNFMAQRIQHDVQIQNKMLQAKGIGDIQKIQMEFLQKAMNDYTAEIAKLAAMGKEAKTKTKAAF